MSDAVEVRVAPYAGLRLAGFVTRWPASLEDTPPSAELSALLAGEGEPPVGRGEELRRAVRDLLRHGGYKPTGRGKPSSEYLVRASEAGALASINPAVDACNAVSLASGVPISVVDLDLAAPPLRVAPAEPGTSYVFNPSGQEIDVGGLLCLFDAEGPCANAVKDAQRTKTSGATRATLSLLWGPAEHADHVVETCGWYRDLVSRCGAGIEELALAVEDGGG